MGCVSSKKQSHSPAAAPVAAPKQQDLTSEVDASKKQSHSPAAAPVAAPKQQDLTSEVDASKEELPTVPSTSLEQAPKVHLTDVVLADNASIDSTAVKNEDFLIEDAEVPHKSIEQENNFENKDEIPTEAYGETIDELRSNEISGNDETIAEINSDEKETSDEKIEESHSNEKATSYEKIEESHSNEVEEPDDELLSNNAELADEIICIGIEETDESKKSDVESADESIIKEVSDENSSEKAQLDHVAITKEEDILGALAAESAVERLSVKEKAAMYASGNAYSSRDKALLGKNSSGYSSASRSVRDIASTFGSPSVSSDAASKSKSGKMDEVQADVARRSSSSHMAKYWTTKEEINKIVETRKDF